MIYFAWVAHGSEPAFIGPINPHTGKQVRELKAGLTEQAFNELVAVLTGSDL